MTVWCGFVGQHPRENCFSVVGVTSGQPDRVYSFLNTVWIILIIFFSTHSQYVSSLAVTVYGGMTVERNMPTTSGPLRFHFFRYCLSSSSQSVKQFEDPPSPR